MSIGSINVTPSSLNRLATHTTSDVNVAKLLYSASVELLETVCYFLDFQEMGESPNFNIKPVTDLLVLGQAAQSASQ